MSQDAFATFAIPIGDFEIDPARGVLTRQGALVPIRAKVYALLSHLVTNRGRVVSKDELFDVLWPDVTVSEDSLTQCVKDLRKVLGDTGQALIRTVPRRGYLLASGPQATLHPAMSRASAPSVAVLRFADMQGDPQDRMLIDGIAEEITIGLSRFQLATVVARNSAFAVPLTDRPPTRQIGETLGADYLVEGWALRLHDRLTVAVSLVEVASDRTVWSEQMDCEADSVSTLNDTIAYKIITRLVSTIEDVVIRNAGASTDDIRAFESLAQGVVLLRSSGPDVNVRARAAFLKAIEVDPAYGVAHAYLALSDVIIAGYAAAPSDVLDAARDRVSRALELAPSDPRANRIMAMIRMFLHEGAIAERFLRRALDLNPYDPDTLAQMGYLRVIRGYPDEGLEWIDRAIRLNPFHPDWYYADRALALFQLGRFEAAINALEQVVPNGLMYEVRLAAAHAMFGNDDAMLRHRANALKIAAGRDPVDIARRALPFEKADDEAHLLAAVRLAFCA